MESRRDCSRVSSGGSAETVVLRAIDRIDEVTTGQAQDHSPPTQYSAPGLPVSARTSSAPSPTIPAQRPSSVTSGHDGLASAPSSDSVSARHFRMPTPVPSEDMPIHNAGVFRGAGPSPSPENADPRAVRTPTVATISSTDYSFTTLYPISSEDESGVAEERPLRLARGREQVLNYLATASSNGLTSFEEGMGVPRPSSPSGSTTSGPGGGGRGKRWWRTFWILLVLNVAMAPVYFLFAKDFFGIH